MGAMKGRNSKNPTRSSVRLVEAGETRRVLLVGGGAREHAIGEALCRTGRVELYVFAHNRNPGLSALATAYEEGPETDTDRIVAWAVTNSIRFAVIGLEDPLAVGLPDVLIGAGIPTVGPVKAAAQLETSKLFLRELMRQNNLPGSVDYHYITDGDSLERTLRDSHREFALKPVGLTAGKGVQVMGVQLESVDEAIAYGRSVISNRVGGAAGILLEERLDGPEFTVQAFVDGKSVRPMPLVKDYKLAYDGDTGPNTGSMGSYSRADGSLSFLTESEYQDAIRILDSVIEAVRRTGVEYRGVAYGQFMKTASGIKLIEINARFGDPEAINVLSVLQTDFVDVCEAILSDSLADLSLSFSPVATVCKYITPPGYPLAPKVDSRITVDVDAISKLGVRVLFAKVHGEAGTYFTTASRSIALLATGSTVEEAHLRAEAAFQFIGGPYHARHDIGTRALTDDAVAKWIPDSIRRQRLALS
jgi:phosphoribosylamine--glycine ligase